MSVTPGVASMDESEVMDIIKNSRAGVLMLVDGDKPYGVPMEHYVKDNSLYFTTMYDHGERKINCIKNNPNACYLIYDSRGEKPELVKQGIRCRSVIIENKISLADIKELDSKEFGKMKLQMLKMDIGETGNWKCPKKHCDWNTPWYQQFPDLVADY